MYHITKKDKKEILKILFEHDCKCRMSALVKKYSYAYNKKSRRAKIREIIKKLNKELQEMIKVEIKVKTIKRNVWVEIYFE